MQLDHYIMRVQGRQDHLLEQLAGFDLTRDIAIGLYEEEQTDVQVTIPVQAMLTNPEPGLEVMLTYISASNPEQEGITPAMRNKPAAYILFQSDSAASPPYSIVSLDHLDSRVKVSVDFFKDLILYKALQAFTEEMQSRGSEMITYWFPANRLEAGLPPEAQALWLAGYEIEDAIHVDSSMKLYCDATARPQYRIPEGEIIGVTCRTCVPESYTPQGPSPNPPSQTQARSSR